MKTANPSFRTVLGRSPLLALWHASRVTTHDRFSYLVYVFLAFVFLIVPISFVRGMNDFTGLFTLHQVTVKAFIFTGIFLLIGLAIAHGYEKYQQRCLPLLEAAAGYHIDTYTGESFHHEIPSTSPYYPWLHLSIPFSRKLLLLSAGIPYEQALSCALTDDELRTLASTHNHNEAGNDPA